MPQLFREAGIEWEVRTFKCEVSIPSFLNILVFELSQRAGTGCRLESLLRWGRGVIYALWDRNSLESVEAKEIRKLVETEIGSL